MWCTWRRPSADARLCMCAVARIYPHQSNRSRRGKSYRRRLSAGRPHALPASACSPLRQLLPLPTECHPSCTHSFPSTCSPAPHAAVGCRVASSHPRCQQSIRVIVTAGRLPMQPSPIFWRHESLPVAALRRSNGGYPHNERRPRDSAKDH
jgi:hypothetical protein